MNETGTRCPSFYPILDTGLALRGIADPAARREHLRTIVADLAQAGVEILQYRSKRDSDSTVIEDIRAIRQAAGLMHLILNDRVSLFDPALWDGVHVGQDDLPPHQVRRNLLARLAPRAILGVSTHNDAQVIAADQQPVDYIAIGPVFSTITKSDTSPVIGLDGVRRARALTTKPLVAIGGITLANAASVCAAGADSLAVISAIFATPNRTPAQAARDFLQIFK